MNGYKYSLRPATVLGYDITIRQMLEFFSPECLIRKITREQAERFIATREVVHPDHRRTHSELSAWGRNAHLKHSRKIFAKAVEWEYMKKNPFDGIDRTKPLKKPWRYITPDEFKELLAIVSDQRVRCLYGVMYGAGLRYGEAINLVWDGRNIDFERGRINVTNRTPTSEMPSFKVKDYEMRSLPMPVWLQDMLIEWQAQAPEGCPFVFITPQRWKIVKRNWQAMRKVGKAKEW